MLIVFLLTAFYSPGISSYAQDKPNQPVYTGNDSWKNKYITRSRELAELRGKTTQRERELKQRINDLEIKLLDDELAPTKQTDAAEDLLKKYVRAFITVLDPKSVSDIFGRRIAKRYVAFQITISNRDKDHQFLLQDISIDLSDVADLESVVVPPHYTPSSNDITLLRGVSEKGQVYDWRNLTLRAFRGLGTLAAGMIGVTTFGSSYAPGVAVFNGPVITSFRDVLPDLTINQLNRLNDSAYQTNTIIPKQGSKVIVAFVDQSHLMDHELRQRFYKDPAAITDIIDFRKAVAVVQGMLITDILEQAPFISTVVINDDQRLHFVDKPASIEGTIVGKNLTGASIQLEDAPAGAEVKVKGIPESNRLNFILTSTNPILPGTILHFVVVKNNDVHRYSYQVPNVINVPMLDSIIPNKLEQGNIDKELTLKGTNFIKSLFSVTGCEAINIKSVVWQSSTEIMLKVDVPADAATGPCKLQVKNGDGFVSGSQTLSINKPQNQ
jgi:hypothetical protein